MDDGLAPVGVELPAERAGGAIAASSRAVLPPIKNDLQMKFVPGFFGEQFFEVVLGLLNAGAGTKAPALRKAVDVGVNRKGWNPEGLRHHHACCFVANAWKSLEFLKARRHLAVVNVHENLGEPFDVAGFGFC